MAKTVQQQNLMTRQEVAKECIGIITGCLLSTRLVYLPHETDNQTLLYQFTKEVQAKLKEVFNIE